MQNVNRMALGELNPHRAGVAAVDVAAPTDKRKGFSTLGYKGAIIEAVVKTGAPSAIALDIYCWSDSASAYIKEASIASLTNATSAQWVVPSLGGRYCWVFLKTLTGGGTIDINVGPSEKTEEDHA
jgi:hypothetical protein